MEEYSYLRDPWNWIDFFIVITGVLYFIPHFKLNINSIRSFRLLRPLKALSSLPSMRKFIHSLIPLRQYFVSLLQNRNPF